ncbi:MAG: RNA 2',3'-cyclic phosphodiesterase [Candidatus Diapherotrites archaeon]|nr:RNA 2',3'-cyclic phosphodiesterase [Candidatus Diapherotrites archaeon]
MRYFFAVPLQKNQQEKIVKFQEKFSECGVKIKFVERENIHITVVFLGEVSKSDALCAFDEVRNTGFEGFEAEAKGVHAFPSDSNSRVLFAGFGAGSEKLTGLIESIENLSQVKKLTTLQKKQGLAGKGIVPHITIGRVKSHANRKLTETILNATDFYFFDININEVQLWESKLTPAGPVYNVVECVVF